MRDRLAGRHLRLLTAVNRPLVANQLQLSLTQAPIIAQGIAANMGGADQSITRDGGGILEYCRINGITVQAWSPMQAAAGAGTFVGNPEYAALNDALERLADLHGVTPTGIAVAWITRHPANMQVVMGTTTPERLEAAAAGSDVTLTRPEWYELFRAAGHIVP